MVEYGNGVGQAGQVAGSGHATSGGPTDLGASIGAGLADTLNQASAALGVPPGVLAAGAIVVVLFLLWLVFVR